MRGKLLTRREALGIGVAGALAGLVGCDTKSGVATGDAMITIGDLVLRIPHWSGKVIGVALITAGSFVKIYFEFSDKTRQDVDIELTPDQMEKIQKALGSGKSFKWAGKDLPLLEGDPSAPKPHQGKLPPGGAAAASAQADDSVFERSNK
jgi:hypothetical protein